MTKIMINEYYDVEDADATKAFGKGEKREDYADAWRDSGNIVLIGLPGSGKAAMAEILAERTGQPLMNPADAEEAVQTLGGENGVIVLDDRLVEDQAVQPVIHGSGKVFYLMADSNTLSQRVAELDGAEDRESLWQEMSARLAVMEPVFYSVLHFILQAAQPQEELVEDALEKVRF